MVVPVQEPWIKSWVWMLERVKKGDRLAYNGVLMSQEDATIIGRCLNRENAGDYPDAMGAPTPDQFMRYTWEQEGGWTFPDASKDPVALGFFTKESRPRRATRRPDRYK